ncbi:thioredoxin family protein [uncultured Maribacter sp.]|uniref:thioredoxin family protein n=1 Tax=uncultured Maribacter sp. TaxID=431308 RepID=UPI002639DD2A|nr:thioredoxin family protein [uncultured Maribacter sp.]
MIVVGRFLFLQIVLCLGIITCKGQEINSLIIEENGKEILLGKIDKKGLQNHSFATWFVPNFNRYQVDYTTIKRIKRKLKKYNVQVFLGTWCGDSKREVPRFFKILNAIDFPENKLEIVALNHTREQYKKSPTGEEKGLNITKVPTFIFYKDGKEVNRIVESPVKSLEKDILSIITGSYTANYALKSN